MKNNFLFRTILLVLLSGFVTAKSNAQNKKFSSTISLKNNSKLPFIAKVVEVEWVLIDNGVEKIDTSNLIIIDLVAKKQVVFQLENFGGTTIRNLLLQVDLQTNQTKQFLITYGTRDFFPAKTFGRYVPERKEDFAWENDKIAFRMYGKELEKTPKEMAYGMDVWVKKTDRMIINERYRRGEYHIDHGDGMDYYHVGLTLGAGNMAPYIDDSIYYSKNYIGYKVLDNGPLRTSFQLIYDEWTVGTKNVKATKTISLDAGSQLNKITTQYSNYSDSGIAVVAGIITRKGNGVKYLDAVNGIASYWEPEHGKDGITGVACIINNPITVLEEKKGQILLRTNTDKNHTITYYAGAVWNKAGSLTSAAMWNDYVINFKQQLSSPIEIKVVKK
jgi:hypothetical protein